MKKVDVNARLREVEETMEDFSPRLNSQQR